ncbi:protein ZNRD2-like [Rhinoraja longicauda]
MESPECTTHAVLTVLLQDKKQKNYCVACQELDSDVDKDNPALNPQAALTQVRERQRLYNGEPGHPFSLCPQDLSLGTAGGPPPSARSHPLPDETAAPAPRPAPALAPGLAGTPGQAERALLRKMAWASGELERAASVEYSAQLCGLIRSCAESLHSLKRLP